MVNQTRPLSPSSNQGNNMVINNHNNSISSASSTSTTNTSQSRIFSDNFWGEKINGFDVLSLNLKHSLTSVKDLEQFVRESLNCEDTYGKLLNKIVSQINKFSSNGSFNPMWSILKELNEKYSTTHVQFVHQLQELIKDIQKYNDEQSKKVKKIRENEQQTQIIVQNFQEIQQQLNKTKEQYHNICAEFDKQRRQLDSAQLSQYQQLSQQQVSASNLIGLVSANSTAISSGLSSGLQNSSGQNSNLQNNLSSLANTITTNKVTQLLKLEKKMKLSLEDYKTSIDKYNLIRVEFERKMADSCNQFQYAEEAHLKQMRSFIETFSRLQSSLNLNKTQIYMEFNQKFSEQFTVDYMLQLFVENKRTGVDRPEIAQFIESNLIPNNLNNLNLQQQQQQNVTLNENDFNLVLNNSSNSSNLNLPSLIPPPISPLQSNNSINLNNNNISTSSSQSQPIDALDNRDYSLFQNTNANRATPTFFSSSNLYSQLTNSSSNSTINTISQINQTTIARSSPINSSPQNEQNKRNDSKGLNIFNVDFLSRNKNKDKKLTNNNNSNTNQETKSKFSRNKKNKQQQQQVQQQQQQQVQTQSNQYETLNQTNSTKDTLSLNSEDSTNQTDTTQTLALNQQTSYQAQNTARSISSITGSLSFDLLDQYKISNKDSDLDSEGYSLRPDSSIDLRRKTNDNLKNDDMNNYYGSSSTSSDSDSDSDGNDGGPVKVMLKINPKTETNTQNDKNTTDVLREISKNLQLKPPGLQNNTQKQALKKRTYYYNYGTSNPEQAESGWTESNQMHRSISVGSVSMTNSINNSKNTANNLNESSLLDLDLNFSSSKVNNNSISLNKVNENSLYNIDEDKEVESSFQYNNFLKKSNTNTVLSSSSPANVTQTNNGRFTPACFPGRTTPDFRHTTSFFEQQGTRASIISPLTINSGSEIIPIAIAFNETIHAYFKIGDVSKFKIKCFGCMKISFPFAILKILAIELPQLEFKLSNLHILNDDLKLNNQLLEKCSTTTTNTSTTQPVENLIFNNDDINSKELKFKFITTNLINELKQQHQQNKLAAFFNFELLKYEFKYSSQAPLVLNAQWSCDFVDQTIELTLDYVFLFRKKLSQANFMILIPNQVTQNEKLFKLKLISSEPSVLTQENDNKLQILWQMGAINTSGKVKAKIGLNQDEGIRYQGLEELYQAVYAKFHIDNDTLSQVKFDILSSNYKLSFLKEKIESGKYFCNNDQMNSQSNMSQSQLFQNGLQKSKSQIAAGSITTQIGSTVDLLN